MRADPRLRRAHVALALTFVAFGSLEGTWTARLPALKRQLELDSGELGLVLFAFSVAATVVLPLAGWLAGRFGSRAPAASGLLVAAGALVGAAFAPAGAQLAVAAAVMGAGVGIVDISANAHGVGLEGRLGRHVLSTLHGMWSVGLLTGSAIAAIAAAAAVGVRANFSAVALGVAVLTLAIVPRLLPGREDAGGARFALPNREVALPALLMFCSMFVESATMSWSAVFLAGPAGAGGAVAAAGVVAFSVAMAASRFVGDQALARWGVGGLARRGGAVACGGIALALAVRAPAAGLVGFALVGVGSAVLVPAIFRVAGMTARTSAAAGIAAVATAGYTGGVVNGPAIGFLARGVGLTAALGLIGVAALVIALLGPRLGSAR
ncbi:MAG TPA: MFS transporter [Gaiellaceae bacterium]|nr:MFS transporter [Gaiellaceae bacterium]